MRDSMVFYRSFADAASELEPNAYKEAIQSILEYALDDKEPECSGVAKALFIMAKPQIDANNKRYENGKKGGRKPKENQTETKAKPKANQTKTKPKPNVNVNVNDNVNVNVNDNVNVYSKEFECIWKAYPRKKEKQKAYKAYQARLKDYSADQLLLATQRYAQECKTLGTEERFIKHGATFFGASCPFSDYLAEDYKPPEKKAEPKKVNSFNDFPQRTYDYDALEKLMRKKALR